ncbi:MAG: hypothetical protein ACLTAX_13515 [Waltera sp.]
MEGKKDEIHNLHHIVATLPSKHFYIIASKILWKNAQKESGIEECYEELFLKYADNILEIEDSIWDIAEERKIEIEPFFMQLDYRTWRRTLESMEHWGSGEDWNKWNSRIREWKSGEDIRYDLFDIKYMGSNLAKITKKTESLPALENQLWTYADMVYEFYQTLLQGRCVARELHWTPRRASVGIGVKRIAILSQFRTGTKCPGNHEEMSGSLSEAR